MPFVPDSTASGFVPDGAGAAAADSPNFPLKIGHDALAGDSALEAKTKQGFLQNAVGAIYDPLAKMVTGAVAKPISDIAGLAATAKEAISPEGGDPEAFRDYVRNQLTYAPQTSAGQSSLNPLNAIPQAVGNAIDYIRPNAAADPSSVGGMAQNAIREAIPQAIGLGVTKFAAPAASAAADANLAKAGLDAAREQIRKAPIDATDQAVVKLGYKIPAATIAPGPVNTAIESIAGKKVIEHTASVNNAIKGDAAMLQDLNLPPQSIWSKGASGNPHPNGEATLDIAAKPYNQVYEDLKQAGPFRVDSQYTQNDLSPPISQGKVLSTTENPPGVLPKYSKTEIKPTINGEDAIESIKSLRAKSGMLFKKAATTNDPADLDAARSTLDAANDLEGLIERNLTTNNSGLLDQFQNARAMLAKINVAKDALVEGGGTFNQKVLGKIAEAKPGYLTGNMAIMGNFANNHPQLVTPMKQIGSPGVHGLSGKLSIGAKALSAIGGFAAGGLPGAAAGVTGEMAVEAAMGSMAKRAAMRTITPSYTPGMVPNALPYLAKALPLTGAVIGENQP